MQIDGVPVFVAETPGPLAAGLVFGVGRKDETFVKGGLTHLVEHLAMSAVGRTALDCNAGVDLDTTEFTATGPPGQVAEFLQTVCRALSDLPLDRLAVEVDVLRTENAGVGGPVLGTVLGELHGLTGFGLAAARVPAMKALTPDDVLGWAARWFHTGNAAVWFTGPVPEGLALPLPHGEPPARSWPVARGLPTPAWTEHPVAGAVGLGAEVGDDPALAAALGVLRERVEDELRHRRGVTYTVDVERLPMAPHRRLAAVVADVREGHESLAAHVLWRQLGLLADAGPAEDELVRERERTAALLDDPRTAAGEVAVRAHAAVLGLPDTSVADLRLRSDAVRADDVRTAAAAVRDGALLCVPQDTGSAPAELPELPAWSADVVDGRSFARRRGSPAPKGARLLVGDEGVSVVLGPEEQVTVRWQDVVGLVRIGAGEWRLTGRDGHGIPVVVDDWRDGGEALAAIRAAVPEALQVVDDDAADGENGLLLLRAPAFRVAEAVAVSTVDADIVEGATWTAVRPVGGQPLEVVQAGIAGYLGRRTITVALRLDHADVEYVLLRGSTPLDRHRWGAASGDADLLAERAGGDPDRLRALLAHAGTPQQVVPELVAALGLPAEVPDLLAGRAVTSARRVRGLGTVAGLKAAVRGDHAPPAGSGPLLQRWAALSRTRPAWYRALSALAAVVCGVALWLLLTSSTAPDGWVGAVLAVLAGAGLLSSVLDARPPRRRPEVPAEAGSAPSGDPSSVASTVPTSMQ